MNKLTLSFAILVTASCIMAQPLKRLDTQVSKFGEELEYALVGGLNTPQFSEADLNNDGTMDLYIFEKTGNLSLTFINQGTENEPDYVYAPEYQQYFPPLTDWVLLRDFDDDGVVDIFTYSDVPGIEGMRVFKGSYVENHLSFTRFNFDNFEHNIIYAEYPGGDFSNLYISFIDYPAIDDIDGDGDLDILTFAVGGGYVYLFNNESVEMGYGKDSLIYRLADDCWGKFYESGFSEIIDLSPDPDDCYDGLLGDDDAERRHAGSTLLSLDMNNDGDKELILGDLSFNNLNLLTNAGSNTEAWMNEQDTFFPSNTLSAEVPIFPASFYLDVDNDGIKDLLASPNSNQTGEDYNCVWYYKNINSNETPVFQFSQRDFMVKEMVDMGTGAHPAFVDYNADGLLDLIVGNNSFFQPFGSKAPRIYLFENTGTPESPEFNLVDDDYLNFSDYDETPNFDPAPTFGDMDNDGDLDVIIGERQGSMFYAENIAGPGNTLAFGPLQAEWMEIDLGQHVVPQIVDLDRDGLPDLVLGERSGRLFYFHNEGTATEPLFVDNIDFNTPYGENVIGLGGVDTRFGNFTGFAAPAILDFDGEYNLFTGSESGNIMHFSNIDGNINGLFTLETDYYGENREGFLTHPAIADMDNDGVLEMVVGNERGGFSMFETTFTVDGSVPVNYVFQQPEVKLFPNPAEDFFTIEIEKANGRNAAIVLYNALGQVVVQNQSNSSTIRIETQNLAAGIYFCEITVGGEKILEKMVINR